MKFPILTTPKINFSRTSAIVWGISLNILMLACLILLDVYIFYRLFILDRPQTIINEPGLSFSEKDIDEVIKIFEEREAKFGRLSGAQK